MSCGREGRGERPEVRDQRIVTAELKPKIGPDDPKIGAESRGLSGVDRAGVSWKREKMRKGKVCD